MLTIDNDFLSMPLLKPSEVRCNNLLTVSEKIIIKKITTLEKSKIKELCEKIILNFDVL